MAVSKCSVQTKKSFLSERPQNMDYELKESVFHGTSQFPLAIYDDNICLEEVMWHWHEEFEVGFITEGSVLIESGSRKYIVHQGDGFFINSSIIHAVKNGKPSCPAALKSIVFHRSIIGGMAGSIFDREYVLPILNNHKFPEYIFHQNNLLHLNMISMIRTAWDAVFEEQDAYELKVRNVLSELFVDLISVCSADTVHNYGNIVRENRVQVMFAFIHDNYGENITLQEIAQQAAISTSEALRCFRQVVGISPMQYLKKYRLSRAAQLLREETQSISEVSTLCGFQDHSYFTRSFREVYGATPRTYRHGS